MTKTTRFAFLLAAFVACVSLSPIPTSWAKGKSHTKTSKKANTKKAKKRLTPAQRDKQHRKFLRVMKAELKRNLKQFATMKHPKVYHLRYRLRTYRQVQLQAIDGQITGSSNTLNSPARQLRVDLRVGNHEFDQTGRDGLDWRIYRDLLPAPSVCPSELTPFVLQKMLWRKTDYKYRLATGQYWRKSYVRSIKPKILDKAGDLSKEPPTVYMAPLQPELKLDTKRWKGILKRISNLSRRATGVISSTISLNAWEEIVLGVGEDGSQVRLRDYGITWSISLSYLGKSKEYMSISDSGYAREEAGLPTEEALKGTYLRLWTQVRDQLNAEEGEPDEGPAIVDPALAGAIFYDILMVRLATDRFLKDYDPRTFAKQLGQAIIPEFLTVIDNPLLRYWEKTPLSSHYLFDDQWVPAQRLVMVKNGILKNFYRSRKPYKTFKRSNGHGRAAFGYDAFSRPGVTIVQSARAYNLPELKQKLLEEMKKQGRRYGYILKRFQGYSQVQNSIYSVTPEQIYRIDSKTGETKLLKGLQVRSAALQVIRGILATGNDYTVFNGSDSEDSGSIQITTVVPSLLLQRLAFHRTDLPEKKGYKIPPPFRPITLAHWLKKPTPVAPKCPKICPAVCKCAVCK